MFTIAKRRNFWVVLGVDAFLIALAYFSSYAIRFDGVISARDLHAFAMTVFWIIPLKLLLLFSFRLYRGMWRYTGVYDLANLVEASAVSSGVVTFGILSLYGFQGFSRGIIVIDFLLTVLFLASYRLAIRFMSMRLSEKQCDNDAESRQTPLKKLLIIGAGDAGERLVREIKENRKLSYDVRGFVDDNLSKLKLTIHGVPVLGQLKNLPRITRDFHIDEIIIAVPSASAAMMRRIVSACKRSRIPFKTVPGMGELVGGKLRLSAVREVRYEDLLGRKPVEIETNKIKQYVTGKRVMVTGAAGSIGSELCRQIALFGPSLLVLIDRNESGLYEMEMELKTSFPELKVQVALGAVQERSLMHEFFQQHRAQVVFHAAAYKHVPMMELHPWEAIFNNVLATLVLLDLCIENGVEKCVIVSSDKAVNPSNVMGATKRLTELLAQAYARENHCQFMAVRFGNVIGSSGSVVPLFQKQIAQGGPVTVTDSGMTRYFMTIREACRLILQAGAIGHGGETFVLKMGTPVNIESLARDMIILSGLKPDEDISITHTGLRPGEKLQEELIAGDEDIVPTRHKKIMVLASHKEVSVTKLTKDVRELVLLAHVFDGPGIKDHLHEVIEEYAPYGEEAAVYSSLQTLVHGEQSGRGDDSALTDRKSTRILVVDNEKGTADLVASYLNKIGYSTSAAYSAQEGLAQLQGEQYDLVITDLMLPDMDGPQLLSAINSQNKRVGVIFMAERKAYMPVGAPAQGLKLSSIPQSAEFRQLEATIEKVLYDQTENP